MIYLLVGKTLHTLTNVADVCTSVVFNLGRIAMNDVVHCSNVILVSISAYNYNKCAHAVHSIAEAFKVFAEWQSATPMIFRGYSNIKGVVEFHLFSFCELKSR